MKNGKKPTRNQKRRLINMKLNPMNWLVVKDNKEIFKILHRESGKLRTIKMC